MEQWYRLGLCNENTIHTQYYFQVIHKITFFDLSITLQVLKRVIIR
jgi:hypothetical protein